MPSFTRLSLRALQLMGGPKIVLAAIPGGIGALADAAGVGRSRVSQVLRQNPLPLSWARLIAELANCSEWEVYEQLGQRPGGAELGPLFTTPEETR